MSSPPLGSDGKPLTPLSELKFVMEGFMFQYDSPMLLEGLKKHDDLNNRVVRVCRPAKPDEGHEGRVKVQLLIGEIFTFAKPSNLFELTPERRAGLSNKEKASLALYEKSNEKCLGVDLVLGARVYSTR